jgi:hypothetical protein
LAHFFSIFLLKTSYYLAAFGIQSAYEIKGRDSSPAEPGGIDANNTGICPEGKTVKMLTRDEIMGSN